MSQARRHHYLPVFHLSRWADDTGKIVRFHRPKNDVVAHPNAPKNTGYGEGLYSLPRYKPEYVHALETSFFALLVDTAAAPTKLPIELCWRHHPAFRRLPIGTSIEHEQSNHLCYFEVMISGGFQVP
jgi:Protein of unknown function (DUF4238)